MIGKTGIGVDHIDIAAATEKGILVTNTPGNHELDVAEYAVGEMLLLMKGYARIDAHFRSGGWRAPSTMGGEMYRSVVGLLGYGNIGRHVAKRLQGWDCEIIAYDPFVTQEQCNAFGYPVKMAAWDDLFGKSDIVSLHLPLNDKTRGCVGKKEFSLMKKSAYVINTSRGPLIDLEALDWALANGEIAGAAIDVHVKEPAGADYPLLKYDNTVLTPHCAGWAAGGLARIAEHAARNTIEALSGKPPRSTVNPDVIPLWRKRFGY
jgi:D-3-phosphoglycerate dehydrogenase